MLGAIRRSARRGGSVGHRGWTRWQCVCAQAKMGWPGTSEHCRSKCTAAQDVTICVKTGTLYCKVPSYACIIAHHDERRQQHPRPKCAKGVLELCILRILQQGEAYTSDIVAALQAVDLLGCGRDHYPLLTRMKNARRLTYRWAESPSGPPRKYYSMTPKAKTSSRVGGGMEPVRGFRELLVSSPSRSDYHGRNTQHIPRGTFVSR